MDWTAAAPANATKADELHDQSAMPAQPDGWRDAYLRFLGLPVLAILLMCGWAAVVFELREAWDSHRDWVPPGAIAGGAAGTVALAYLIWRKQFGYLLPAASLISLGLVFLIWNIVVDEGSDAPGWSDALTIMSTVSFAVGLFSAVIGLILAEMNDPTKAPAPAA